MRGRNKNLGMSKMITLVLLFVVGEASAYQYKDYDVRISPTNEFGESTLQIFQKNKLVFKEQGYQYTLNESGKIDAEGLPPAGQDITGDGEPDLVISKYSGGAHCCYDIRIFSIGKKFRAIDSIAAEDGYEGFKDLNGDGILEFVGRDWSFAYWNACFADSPAPKIILSYQHGKYLIDQAMMKRPLTEIKEEKREGLCEVDNAWERNGYCLKPEIWGHMLDLIYAGHAQVARNYLAQILPDETTKQSFLKDFKQQLSQSSYATLFQF